VDVASATDLRVIVSRLPGYVLREVVAEHTIFPILAVLRKGVVAHKFVEGGKCVSYTSLEIAELVGKEIRDKVVRVIGLGNIGLHVVEILKVFDSKKILVYDSYVDPKIVRAMETETIEASVEASPTTLCIR